MKKNINASGTSFFRSFAGGILAFNLSTNPFFSGRAAAASPSDIYNRLVLLLMSLIILLPLHCDTDEVELKAEDTDDGHMICFDCNPVGEKLDTTFSNSATSNSNSVMGSICFIIESLQWIVCVLSTCGIMKDCGNC